MAGVRKDGILQTDDVGSTGAAVDATIVAPLGQQVMAASIPVVIASDQSPITVVATIDPTGLATEAKQDAQIAQLTPVIQEVDGVTPYANKVVVIGVVNDGDGTVRPLFYNSSTGFVQVDVSNIDAALSTRASEATLANLEVKFGTLGQKVMAGSAPVVIASNQSAIPITAAALPLPAGAATEVTLATLLTLAGFQARINTLGQKAMAASTPVVLASDQTPISTKTDLTPAAPAVVSVGIVSGPLVAANANRKGLRLVNNSSARISLGFGSPAVLDSGMTLYPTGTFNMDEYDFDLGVITAIASAAASNCGVQEFST